MCVGVLFIPFQEGRESITRYLGLSRPWNDRVEATRLSSGVIADKSANEDGAECERNTRYHRSQGAAPPFCRASRAQGDQEGCLARA